MNSFPRSCMLLTVCCFPLFFFFNDTATTEIYTLSLHDALPIYRSINEYPIGRDYSQRALELFRNTGDRKSTRLNSSHRCISYAVFCLKKKIKTNSESIQPNNA